MRKVTLIIVVSDTTTLTVITRHMSSILGAFCQVTGDLWSVTHLYLHSICQNNKGAMIMCHNSILTVIVSQFDKIIS